MCSQVIVPSSRNYSSIIIAFILVPRCNFYIARDNGINNGYKIENAPGSDWQNLNPVPPCPPTLTSSPHPTNMYCLKINGLVIPDYFFPF